MKFMNLLSAGLAIVVVVLLVLLQVQKNKALNEKTDLLNKLAKSEETVKIAEGLYMKQVLVSEDLQKLLDNANQTVHALTEQLERAQAKIVSLNEIVVYWKKKYEGAVVVVPGPQPDNPELPPECVDHCSKVRTRIDFKKDFGPIRVEGHTITNPAEGHVSVEQTRPLKLTVALTQNKRGEWKTYVVSSEDDMEVEINFSAIDVKHFEKKWYEKIGIVGTVAVGDSFYTNIGLTYDIRSVTVGPVYGRLDGSNVYGLTAIVRPFSK